MTERAQCLDCGQVRAPAQRCDECTSTRLEELRALRREVVQLRRDLADDAAAESACVLEAQREAELLRLLLLEAVGYMRADLGMVSLRALADSITRRMGSKKGAPETGEADTLIQGFAPPTPAGS